MLHNSQNPFSGFALQAKTQVEWQQQPTAVCLLIYLKHMYTTQYEKLTTY